MGSFNVACSVSRITICPGDPTVYFPLEVYEYAYDIKAHNNMLIYPWCYYIPLTLPIFGEYADYGRIDQIEKNENIKVIEKYFKYSIDEIVDNRGKFSSVGMFVHREIFDCMVKTQIDEWGNTKTRDSFGNRSRYYYEKKYDEFREELIKFEKIKKGIQRIKNKENKAELTEKEKMKKSNLSLNKAMCNLHFLNGRNVFQHREYKTFNKIYNPCIREGKLKKQLIDLIFFESSMSYTNVHYFPAANGCQFGNHYGNRIIHQKAIEILNKTIQEDEKDREEFNE